MAIESSLQENRDRKALAFEDHLRGLNDALEFMRKTTQCYEMPWGKRRQIGKDPAIINVLRLAEMALESERNYIARLAAAAARYADEAAEKGRR
jgi:hypothetical protein